MTVGGPGTLDLTLTLCPSLQQNKLSHTKVARRQGVLQDKCVPRYKHIRRRSSEASPGSLGLNQGSYGAVPMTACRAERENEGLGEDPPGSTMTYQQVLRTWMFSQGSDGAVPVTARRAKRENGGLGEDPPGSTMTL